MTIMRLVIAQYERALVWSGRRFVGILNPGVRWVFAPGAQVVVQMYDVTVPEFEHPRLDLLLQEARTTMQQHFDLVELAEHEVGIVYKSGKLAGVLAPGQRQLYWKGPIEVRVEKLDVRLEAVSKRVEERGAYSGHGDPSAPRQ